MKKILFLLLLTMTIELFAQEKPQSKFALVIGNGNYVNISKLNNPVNDANDMASVLQSLGFTVEKVLNGNLEQMENAVLRLKNRLSVSKDAYGFLFYAGHGVQSAGENYLLPVDANIPSEIYLRQRAVSVQTVLGEINSAGNQLNVIVLDACRDNPFSWSRGGSSRGLAIVSYQPADSIIVFATSAGSTASDGTGRNGLFTGFLLNNLKTPGIEVNDVFRQTMGDVVRASANNQRPAIYNQFPGTAYLGSKPEVIVSAITQPEQNAINLKQTTKTKQKPLMETRFNSIGAAIGSSFAAPIFMMTARGTFSPLNYLFVDAGIDFGLGSIYENKTYYSIYPFAHGVFYKPFNMLFKKQLNGAYYGGIGLGLMHFKYTFNPASAGLPPRKDLIYTSMAADFLIGINFINMIDVSYTLRTNFKSVNNKLSVGYTWRFL